MRSAPVLVTPPAAPVVTLEAMKTYARIDGTDEDGLLATFIQAATEQLELFTNRAFVNRTLRQTLDSLYSYRSDEWWDGTREGAIGELIGRAATIPLRPAPIRSIVSVTTYDAAGVATILDPAGYVFDGSGFRLADGFVLPAVVRPSAGIVVDYVAGYGPAATDVPAMLRMAVMVQAQVMYDARTCVELCESAMKMVEALRLSPMPNHGL